ncbi:MAG: hypothetical protein IJC16_02895 [Rikenellaceae bacterium]|nr:hypothetical protein [Rikenellaceae bacterium]
MIRLCAVSLALLGCLASTARAQQAVRVYMSWADIAHERYTVADSLCRESIESKAELMGAGGYFRFSAPGDRTLDKQLRRKAVAVALHDSLFVNSSLWNMERRYTYAERMGDRIFFASRYRVGNDGRHLEPFPDEAEEPDVRLMTEKEKALAIVAGVVGSVVGGVAGSAAVGGSLAAGAQAGVMQWTLNGMSAGGFLKVTQPANAYYYMVDLQAGTLHPLFRPDEMGALLESYPVLKRRYDLEKNYRRGSVVAVYLSEWFELEKRRLAETE